MNDKLQYRKQQPRWLPRPRAVVYLGKSPYYTSNMPLVINLKTGHINLQYHCVYDDNFTTVNAINDVDKIKLLSRLYKSQLHSRTLVDNLDVMKILMK